jgi:hypothetical protein
MRQKYLNKPGRLSKYRRDRAVGLMAMLTAQFGNHQRGEVEVTNE